MASSSSQDLGSPPPPKIAVVGCGHGQLDAIYATLEDQCLEKGWTLSDIDFLIICGDFQAARNESDLNCMSVPRKYRKMGDFHKYYSGAATAPVLTLVIGGNHEASGYLSELRHGGWLAPNIYYLGVAGVVRYGPWRIAGLSGIYYPSDYRKPHHERRPYGAGDVRSVYHVREVDVQRLLQIRSHVDVALSHDWPAWVELFGDYASLFAAKPYFLDSAKIDKLGSKPASEVMNHLRPSYWFSGHMHIRFTAVVEYKDGLSLLDTAKALPVSDNIKASLPVFKRKYALSSSSELPPTPVGSQSKTEFLGLDKAGAYPRLFMELKELQLPTRSNAEIARYSSRNEDGKFSLYYDEEWLAITRASLNGVRVADAETESVPPPSQKDLAASLPQQHVWVKDNIVDRNLLKIPENFKLHAPVHNPVVPATLEQPPEYPNQQTACFTELLQIPN
ncbi:hypothetical protein AK830_g8066 [Neonectria ditissima]|uniref:Lariat debranching enzyme C-terminal domain-containing protein n=1 Tax=Neonectria ditissima TaxID=78410 RepID=A0A0P7BF13_9HYPO|nr:hypothetical protein AK830_g8066 [Neonectria ditissima]